MLIHFIRIFRRVIVFYTRFWAIAYPLTTIVFFYFLSFKKVGCNLFDFCNPVFWSATGVLAVLIIAIKESRISELTRKSNFFPLVVRNTKSSVFEFKLGKGLILKGEPLSVSDLNNVLGIRIKNDNIAYSLRGYVLHEGFFYPLSIIPEYALEEAIEKFKHGEKRVELTSWNKYTWASKGHDLFFFLDDQNKKGPIKFKGSYYCILFSDNSGENYFLEEDDGYYLRVRNLKESRPGYFRDFIYWLDLFEKDERQKIESK